MHNLLQIRNILILSLAITCVFCLPIYAQDQHTVLLYTFETGSGTTVKDLSDYGKRW